MFTVRYDLNLLVQFNISLVFKWLHVTLLWSCTSFFQHNWILVKIRQEEGTAVARWLRYCATNRKVAGSIPDGVSGIFHWHNPSKITMALGSTQPRTEMSKGKGKAVPWFQTFAVFWIMYVFFWVFPRRPTVVCRRMKYEVLHTSYFTSSPWRWNW